jgi:peptidyl-prolyl cis-trans isomerase A (cyclophilin A)
MFPLWASTRPSRLTIATTALASRPNLAQCRRRTSSLDHQSHSPDRRFADLLQAHYFDGCRFHRVVPGFITQWGIPADPQLYSRFGDNKIKDDPVKTSNKKGTISFATSGANARGSQMFVNLADNASLDGQGFAPFAVVVGGMECMERVHAGYAERGPDQARAKEQGNAYLAKEFSKLSYIKTAVVRS